MLSPLLGSHGMLYAWSPRVGLDVTVFQALEDALWNELRAAVGDNRFQVHSSAKLWLHHGCGGNATARSCGVQIACR
jgi:hypothetical protein